MISLTGWIWIARIVLAILVIEGVLIFVTLCGNGRD